MRKNRGTGLPGAFFTIVGSHPDLPRGTTTAPGNSTIAHRRARGRCCVLPVLAVLAGGRAAPASVEHRRAARGTGGALRRRGEHGRFPRAACLRRFVKRLLDERPACLVGSVTLRRRGISGCPGMYCAARRIPSSHSPAEASAGYTGSLGGRPSHPRQTRPIAPCAGPDRSSAVVELRRL